MAAWWETAPGGAASSANDADRIPLEQGGVGKTISKQVLLSATTAHAANTANPHGVTAAQTGSATAAQGARADAAVVITNVLGTDQTASGVIVSVTVSDASAAFGLGLTADGSGGYTRSNADAAATMPILALALESGTGTKQVLLHGYIRDDAWDWTPGALVYGGLTAGGLVQGDPAALFTTAGDQVQVVGYAFSGDILYFCPSLVLVEI